MKSGDGDETGLSIGGGRKVEMGMSVKRTRRRTRGLRIERLELRDLFAGDPIDGLGVLGDALSDEYFDQLIGVGASWVQILQSGRQIATGPTGRWGEPRRSGFEYNWGRKGATSADLQAQGQTQGLLGQIASGDVTHAVLMIGTEDFGLDKPTYQSLINGTLPPSQVDALVNQILDRLDTALADLRFSNAKVLLVNLADESLTPAARSFMPIAATRDRVSVVIDRVNAGLRDLANAHHVPLLDLHGLEARLLGTNSQPVNSWRVGGVTITNSSGTAATNAFVVDGVTPHTITQTVISNLMITGLNLGYEAGLTTLTEAEMLAQSGLSFQGQNTLGINYADYVILPRLPFFLDYGAGTTVDDFSQRIAELTNRLGIAAPSAGEIASLKASIKAFLDARFKDYRLLFLETPPVRGQFESVRFGHRRGDVAGALPGSLGLSEQDWLNLDEGGIAYLFPAEFFDGSLANLSRSQFLSVLGSAMGYYATRQVGAMLGLARPDAYGDPHITSLNYDNTGAVQNRDPMSADNLAPLEAGRFGSTASFGLSLLSRAKLFYSHFASAETLPGQNEIVASHNSIATAMPLSLQDLTARGLFGLRAANLESGILDQAAQVDIYSIDAIAGDLLTAQVLATGVYAEPGSFDARLRLLDANGNPVAVADDTFLGPNSFGSSQTGTLDDTDPLILNQFVPASGRYYLEVIEKNGVVGAYDLFVLKQDANPHPWRNPRRAEDVDDNGIIAPLDAILVINELNNPTLADRSGRLPVPPNYPIAPPPFVDVSGNDLVAALDAILVINTLNAAARGGGSPEGEASSWAPVMGPRSVDAVFRAAESAPAGLDPWNGLASAISQWQESLVTHRRRR